MSKAIKILKKIHRWPGFIIALFLLYFAVTGIFMNHRELIAPLDINRTILPQNYEYKNWNLAAIKGNVVLGRDSILLFGNIGVWLTDSSFSKYLSFNQGFPSGIDNKKIFDLHVDTSGHIYAASLFGLFAYDRAHSCWTKILLDQASERFVAIETVHDSLYVLSRSHLYIGKSNGVNTILVKHQLPTPSDYQKKVSLFATIWQTHSGEILGLPGKIFVDILGVITIFLSFTGILYFIFPQWVARRVKKGRSSARAVSVNRWSLRWHNLIGSSTFVFLIILFFTGMFLRPPLLISIARFQVSPLTFSHLDQPNPWFDKLRDMVFDPEQDRLLLSTSEGIYYLDFKNKLAIEYFRNQPPVSVMGINTFQYFGEGTFLVGSFSGLFLWNPLYPEVFNYVTRQTYVPMFSGRPVGDYKITGIINTPHREIYLVDYDRGVLPVSARIPFPQMPEFVCTESDISLWNLCLEIHTGRFFQNLLSDYYILIVPIAGLISILVVISGYLLWRKKYKNKQNKTLLH